MRPKRVVLVGAGQRGRDAWTQALLARPDLGVIAAVCDPNHDHVARLVATLPDRHVATFASLSEALAADAKLDVAVVATPDDAHVAPTLKALEAGLDVLLEKPVALREDDLRILLEAEQASTGSVAVAHVLRYAPAYEQLKHLIDSGAIGELRSIEHTENVGHAHFAHSYVRGHWRSTATAAPMLLAKACHDLDIIRMLAGAPPEAVASWASARWFTAEHAPSGAPERCLDGCPVEDSCPFHAGRVYLEHYQGASWPRSVVAWPADDEGVTRALQTGPYGRCVFRSDNDVVDHQTVQLEFPAGLLASLTVTAFDARNTRETTVRGSLGTLKVVLEDGVIEHTSFATGRRDRLPVAASVRHAAEDAALLHHAFEAWSNEGQRLRTGLREAADSHLMAFAAETSRQAGGMPVTMTRLDG
jgi:predicted dehydrogenase